MDVWKQTLNPDGVSVPLCACGCGDPVILNRSGKPNTYLRGHSRRGKVLSIEQRAKLSAAAVGRPGPWKGKTMPLSARQKMSVAKKGGTLGAEHRAKISASMTGKPHPAIHRKASPTAKLNKRLAQLGPLGSGWKGGVSAENARARASYLYREWREAVFTRDSYTCQHCGARNYVGPGRRVVLHPHHIKPFATFKELRFEILNGITLCKPCHDRAHGRGKQL